MKGSGTSLAAAGTLPVAVAIRSSWPRTESVIMTGSRVLGLSGALWSETWMHHCAVACQCGCFDDIVVPIDRERFAFFVDQELEEGKNILGIEARGGRGEPTRDVGIADDFDAIALDHLVGAHALDIAAAFDGEIDHHRAGPHRGHHFFADEARRRPA